MTGSWDKTLKFWDTRQAQPLLTVNLSERVYCADMVYPMAAIGLANKQVLIYQLENQPTEYKRVDSNLKFQSRCISIFCDKKNTPCGFGLGSVEGRVSIQYVNGIPNPKDNFTFKCHRSAGVINGYQDIYAVNDIAFHPIHGTLATIGSDCKYGFWDKDARTKLKTSDQLEGPVTKCAINARGEIFAYAIGYDWSKGHEFASQNKKVGIYLYPCFEDLKPKNMKK
ncbi:hypothetical protein RND71_043719 [Anisodus tanguticus]|uniref:mRNA export factor n=1 Tax=Anisodus tanguticus TaxID=243964 RepID=A0AAE1QP93_9SOLA|nr:hypothetical protein RND71_043719 [Anisodus tanguticus]